MDLWALIKSTFGINKDPLLKFSDMLKLTYDWAEFGKGIKVRGLPCKINGVIMFECYMEAGAIAPRHVHDYFEGFIMLDGKMRDNLTGQILEPSSKSYYWRSYTAHEPEALTKCHFIGYCKK
jgi:hypothetical protein